MSVFPFSNYSSWCLIALHSFPKQLLGHGDLNGNVVMALLLDKTGHLARENQVVTGYSHSARVFSAAYFVPREFLSACVSCLREQSTGDRGILMTSLERQIQRWVSQIRRGTAPLRHGGQLPPHCCLSSSSPFCPGMN